MSRHTPGPWREDYRSNHRYRIVGGEKEDSICEIALWITDYEEQSANARLIAAAPELLAALKKVKRILNSPEFRAVEDYARVHGVQYRGNEFTQPDMDNAIRKAEGETDAGKI